MEFHKESQEKRLMRLLRFLLNYWQAVPLFLRRTFYALPLFLQWWPAIYLESDSQIKRIGFTSLGLFCLFLLATLCNYGLYYLIDFLKSYDLFSSIILLYIPYSIQLFLGATYLLYSFYFSYLALGMGKEELPQKNMCLCFGQRLTKAVEKLL